ncbi:SDR family NAD(P)-dependent oxidoreductase [Spirochaeta isovalerica]|uniref:Ketoreductase domain-containing protein n=1 Tax=Spirochaeta isovalerica TaxID=150 RepID=A0A841RAI8_9SPIO|nr:SDR family NAD(P)-dependent oxidoreductase [Spirochaeta isovalerica]MBB6480030.1 hypothetical protein [Spirochaeta isovalerica]
MPDRKEKFADKYGPWALVAGASEGLGAAFAESLASRGINLIIIARRREPLELLGERLEKKHGITVIARSMDLGDVSGIREYIDGLSEEIGLLVYNAAYAPIGLFSRKEESDLMKVPDVNIRAPLLLTKLLTDKMIPRKKGGIILMSSLSGFQGGPGLSAYSASKAFNTVLAEGLWAEMKKEGIDVMACCAGAVRTPGYSTASRSKEAPGTLDPQQVAEEAVKALGKGPVYIPGKLNRLFRFILGRLVSRKKAVKIMEYNTKDLI